jgi:hypothetical protein
MASIQTSAGSILTSPKEREAAMAVMAVTLLINNLCYSHMAASMAVMAPI